MLSWALKKVACPDSVVIVGYNILRVERLNYIKGS